MTITFLKIRSVIHSLGNTWGPHTVQKVFAFHTLIFIRVTTTTDRPYRLKPPTAFYDSESFHIAHYFFLNLSDPLAKGCLNEGVPNPTSRASLTYPLGISEPLLGLPHFYREYN